jgi:hypothetical protein
MRRLETRASPTARVVATELTRLAFGSPDVMSQRSRAAAFPSKTFRHGALDVVPVPQLVVEEPTRLGIRRESGGIGGHRLRLGDLLIAHAANVLGSSPRRADAVVDEHWVAEVSLQSWPYRRARRQGWLGGRGHQPSPGGYRAIARNSGAIACNSAAC